MSSELDKQGGPMEPAQEHHEHEWVVFSTALQDSWLVPPSETVACALKWYVRESKELEESSDG